MSELIVGIDLGTTNSEIAVVREGQVEVLAIEPGTKLLPSVVGLADDGSLLVGRSAANQYVLYPERIINEPTAAALAYEAGHPEQKQILVYDLGGGTFDVSIVRMEQGVVEVLASHGNNQLGGDDFDQKIVTHVLEHIKTQHGVDATASRQAMARITRAAEAAKITLSDHPFARLEEEYLLDHQGAPIHLSLEIARSDYEAMIEAYIDETLEAVHIALSGAGLTVSQLDEVLLVGGATRTPVIQRRLGKELHLPPHSEVEPELCVASGAAIQAAVIAGTQVSRVLVDITPYAFGTSAISELNGE